MKVVAFDMEGTLFEPISDGEGHTATSLWQEIPRVIGKGAPQEQLKLYKRWKRDEFESYLEFTRATVDMHSQYDITQEQFNEALQKAEIRDGVYSTFDVIGNHEVKTALVTGSFKELANVAQRSLGIDHVFASCEYFWNDDGSFSHANILPTDEHGKRRVVKSISQSYGLSSKDVIYVGDNTNDKTVLEWAEVSIGINPPSELDSVIDYSVDTDTEGFDRVADILENELDRD